MRLTPRLVRLTRRIRLTATLVVEHDGVIAAWFDRHGCRAAIVRPDHYVFGVANDEGALAKRSANLRARLQ